MEARFTPIADHALLVSFADEISDGAHAYVVALDQVLAAHPPVGMVETVPALVNILVDFDPLATDHKALEETVRGRLHGLKPEVVKGTTHHVQVCYDPAFGPDLSAVSTATGLSEDAVINVHLSGDYKVLMYGFAPGYAYLAGVPGPIQVPRKPSAVRDVPAGSVIIAGPQALVTTITMPTGWSIIGRSPTQILAGQSDKPFLFDVGDKVIFERISRREFDRLERQGRDG